MDFFISSAVAQAEGGAAGAGGGAGFGMFLPLIILIAFFYFIGIRPQMKRQKEHRAMVEALAKGDEVVTNGGVLGKIQDIADGFISVEIADKVVVKVQRHAIAAVVPKGTLKAKP